MDPICTIDTPLYGMGLPYWARPGVALFAKKTETEGEDDEDEDDEEDDDEDEEEDDEDAEKTPEELRDELKTIREALKSASGQSKKRRQQLQRQRKEHEAELDRVRGKKPKAKDDEDDAPAPEAIREAVRREEREKADERTKRAEARGALRGAGIPADRVAKAVGLLDLGDLDVDDDGAVDGLDDAIADLKREWPELFPGKGAKRRRPGSGPADDGERDKGSRRLSADQQQARTLTGRR